MVYSKHVFYYRTCKSIIGFIWGYIIFRQVHTCQVGGVVINPLTGINMLIKRIPMGMTIPHIILYPIVREIYHYKFHVSPLYPCLLVLACFSTCIRHIIIIHIYIYICICMYILPDCFFKFYSHLSRYIKIKSLIKPLHHHRNSI